MTTASRRRPTVRALLISLLVIAVVVLGAVAVVVIPIFTHQSAGLSGQVVPDSYVSRDSARGEDGRNRTVEVRSASGDELDMSALKPGDRIVVTGSGFDAGIGIYVGFCAIPATPDVKPGPCLGGLPEGAMDGEVDAEDPLASAWVTSDWAWKSFATHSYLDTKAGTFEVVLTVPEATSEGVDCNVDRCAVTTRSDHTAASDRVQDILLPYGYAK
ncbi:hypothetical protein ICL81_04645 [Leucobacter sp. cx-328]|uniref:hypothetical protein n=1 Tax=unclassified Leucobacter TaxID=2621730 RepID=UPI00165E4E47|nr:MULTISPECIES: hypothetical protein [unclassified Leucobacter]MBC9943815.1 hypothetical protein [Leucobacter sp. cx-328]